MSQVQNTHPANIFGWFGGRPVYRWHNVSMQILKETKFLVNPFYDHKQTCITEFTENSMVIH